MYKSLAKIAFFVSLLAIMSCGTIPVPDIDFSDNAFAIEQNIISEQVRGQNEGILKDGRSFINAGFTEGADDTRKIQNSLDAGYDVVFIPNIDREWEVEPISVSSNTLVVFEKGAVVTARKDYFHHKNSSLVKINEAANVTLLGYGAQLKMQKKDYTSSAYEWSEWRMGIILRSSKSISIRGLRVSDSGGDGIYVGASRSSEGIGPDCENIIIEDLVLDNHYRQGISIIGVDGLLIKNVIIYNTYGTAPAAGIDFEPNHDFQKLKNILVTNCDIRNNQGPGILFFLGRLTQDSEPIDVVVEDSIIHNWPLSLQIEGAWSKPTGKIVIRNSDIEGLKWLSPGDSIQFIIE